MEKDEDVVEEQCIESDDEAAHVALMDIFCAAGPAVGPRAGFGVGRFWRAWGAWGGRCGLGGMLLWIQQLDGDQFLICARRPCLKYRRFLRKGCHL